jgi:hypothetical protein
MRCLVFGQAHMEHLSAAHNSDDDGEYRLRWGPRAHLHDRDKRLGHRRRHPCTALPAGLVQPPQGWGLLRCLVGTQASGAEHFCAAATTAASQCHATRDGAHRMRSLRIDASLREILPNEKLYNYTS